MNTRMLTLSVVALIMVMVTLACGPLAPTQSPQPSPSPTSDASAIQTFVAETVAAELNQQTAEAEGGETEAEVPTLPSQEEPTVHPTMTTPPTVSPPTPTQKPVSTSRPTPTVPPPTATPEPCSVAIAPEFASRLAEHPDWMAALGCPLSEARHTWAAEQRFQGGRMFWFEETDTIHILYEETGTYAVEMDQYVEGDPEDACPEVGGAPAGLVKPVRGFNWHWCNTAGVRDQLRWGLESEAGYDAIWQPFEMGAVFQSRTGHMFVLFANGTWAYAE